MYLASVAGNDVLREAALEGCRIRGLPADRIRFHLCWGSWHGPHTTDLPMADIVDVLLAINAGAYSSEAANARHEHEWKVWRDVKLPDGNIILPGVVTHSTNVVEHPELVADRIVRFAEAVSRENVVASTDCGLGGRVHPQIAWAKLDTPVKGAELALGLEPARSVRDKGTREPQRDRAEHAGGQSPGACAPSRPGERLAHDRTFALH